MPRGVSRYDEAQLQRQLWTPDFAPFTEGCWDTLDLSGIATSTGVSQLNDRSGHARHMTQATAGSQPALVAGPNGIGWGLQSGGSKYMTAPMSGAALSTGAVICYVFRRDSGTTGQIFDIRSTSNGTPILDDSASVGFCARRRNDVGGIGSTAPSQTVDSNWNVGTVAYDGINIYSRKNGGSEATGAQGGVTTGFDRIGLMSNGFTPGTGVPTATIAALVVLNDFTKMQQLEGYLAWRWRLSLASSHRFVNRPPLIGD